MKIAPRFGLALGFLVTAMLMLGLASLRGLAELRESSRGLTVAVEEAIVDGETRADLLLLRGKLQAYVLAEDSGLRRELRAEIDETAVEVEGDLAEMRRRYAQRPQDLRLTETQAAPYRTLMSLLRTGRFEVAGGADERRARTRLLRQVRETSQPMVQAGDDLALRNVELARAAQQRADDSYRRTRTLLLLALVTLAALGAAAAVWLVQSVLPRTRRYAAFARDVAAGGLDARVAATGRDELAELGRSLNAMVAAREVDRLYAQRQSEFATALQVAEGEDEAHQLLKRHLERTVPEGTVTVLNKNNSADRLEAKTPVVPGTPLAGGLDGAGPRSCLAVRFARTYRRGDGQPAPLLDCDVCGALAGGVTCQPMLVSGEVIGSLLVHRDADLNPTEDRHLVESVAQAAPVLGNLRNLAVAESRAATDALTGLPNSRSVRETMRQMAAQAARAKSPLAVAMLDLDHFKQINDTYGHGAGDDVLAAVGTVLRASIRDSDFVGRIGGEEFVLLLPDTSAGAALVALEKVRAAVGEVSVVGVERTVTASIGVAVIPDHAGTMDGALRAADRALYAAKESGRNTVVTAVGTAAHRDAG